MKKKYLYNGQLMELADIQDAATQSNLDVNAYIQKAGIREIEDSYIFNGKKFSAADILDAANQSNLGFDDYIQKAGFQFDEKKNLSVSGTPTESDNSTVQSVPTTSQSFVSEPSDAFALLPKPKVNIAGVNVTIDAPIKDISPIPQIANQETLAQQLQNRINTKTYTPEDIGVVAQSMKVSVPAANAYMNGNVGTGTVIHFNDIKASKQDQLKATIDKANQEFGLGDTFEEVFASPEVAGQYIQKIETLSQNKANSEAENSTQQAQKDNPILFSLGNIYVDKSQSRNTLTSAQQIKSIISNDIIDKITEDDTLNVDQKVQKIYSLVDSRDKANVERAIDKRLSPLRYMMNVAIGGNTSEDIDLLNSNKAGIEFKVNQVLKDKVNYNTALKRSIAEEYAAKVDSQEISAEDTTARDYYAKRIADVESVNTELSKQIVPDNLLYDKYPALYKSAVADAINEFNAIQSGNVKGYEDGGYEGVTLAEHLAARGFDKNDQRVKDVVTGGNLKDYSFFGSPIKTITDVFTGTGKSILDLTPLRDEATILAEKKEGELMPTQIGANDEFQLTTQASTAQNIVNTTAQVLGQGLLQWGTGGIGRLAGLTKTVAANTAFFTSGALVGYDSHLKESYDLPIETDAGRVAYAGVNSIFEGAIEKLFPEAKFFQIPGFKDAAVQIASKLSAGELTDKLATELLTKAKNSALDYIGKYSSNISRESAEEGLTKAFNSANKLILGDPNTTFDTAIEDVKNTVIQTAIGTSLIGGFGAVRDIQSERNVSAKSTIYNAAIYHDEALDAINLGYEGNLYDSYERDAKVAVLNNARQAVNVMEKTEIIEGKTLTRPERELYVANLTAEAVLTGQKKGMDNVGQEAIDEKVSNLENQRKQILNGEVIIDEYGNITMPTVKPVQPETAATEVQATETTIPASVEPISETTTEPTSPVLEETTEGGITVQPPQTFPEPITIGGNEQQSVTETEPQPSTVDKNEALKDVESTHNAFIALPFQDIVDLRKTVGINPMEDIAKEYHKAKKDNSNPKLVKAVEEALSQKPKPQPSTVKSEEVNINKNEKNIEITKGETGNAEGVSKITDNKELSTGDNKGTFKGEALSDAASTTKALDNSKPEIIDYISEKIKSGLPYRIKQSFNKDSVLTTISDGLNDYSPNSKEGKRLKSLLLDPLTHNAPKDAKYIGEARGESWSHFILKEKPDSKAISEAYHKAKADNSNPELVKAVEEALAPKSETKPIQPNEVNTEADTKDKQVNITTEAVSPTEEVVTETAQPTETQTGEVGNIPPETTIADAPIPQADGTGIIHAATADIREEFGLPEYGKEAQTFAEWDSEADVRIKNGEMPALLQKLRNGDQPSAVEVRMMGKYIAYLKGVASTTKTNEDIDKLHEAIKLSDSIGGTENARGLVARKGLFLDEGTLADFFQNEMEASKVDVLTNEQKTTVEKEHADIAEAQKKWEEERDRLNQKIKDLQAEAEINKNKPKKTTTTTKKTHEDFVKEREAIIQHLKDKLRQARSGTNVTIIPYANDLFAAAPDVARLVKSLVEEGITKLADVIDNVHDVLKDSIPDVTKDDVRDIIAGAYNKPQKTRSQTAKELLELKMEAKLINQLIDLQNGVQPQNNRQQIEYNQKIKDLRSQIAKFRKENITDEEKLQALKGRYETEIKKVEEDLRTGKFLTPQTPAPKLKLDKAALDAKDKLIKLKNERQLRLLKEQYKNRTGTEKALNVATDILNIPRALQTTLDFSAVLRQGLIPTISHPILAFQAGRQMFKSAWSQKEYDRWFSDLEESPQYNLMKESGLALTDNTNLDLTVREEAFMSNLAEKIPIVGQQLKTKWGTIPGANLIKKSERAYAAYINKLRVDLFSRMSESMEERGLTFENSPKQYKEMAEYINNATGRGSLGKQLNKIAPLLNGVFFSPRLIASRLNMLTYFAQPRFYRTAPIEVRKAYFADMAKFIGVGIAVLALAKYAGDDEDEEKKITVELDPRSSDFGKIRQGNTRWDIWGGFQPFIRVVSQIFTGERKSTNTGEIYDITGEGAFSKTRGDVLAAFARGKLAPVPSMAVDMFAGRNAIGEKIIMDKVGKANEGDKEITIDRYMKEHLLPLTYTGVKEAMDEKGIKSLFTVGIPSVFGIGTQTYEPSIGKGQTITVYKNGKKRDSTPEEYKKYEAERETTKEKLLEKYQKSGVYINKYGEVTTEITPKKRKYETLTDEEKKDLDGAVARKSAYLAKKKLKFNDK